MGNATARANTWNGWHLAALLGGNAALALGPWWVRLADSGPVAAGFWRLALAVPFIALLARASGQRLTGFTPLTWAAIAGAGVFFALDLASWHIGIGLTRLGNAALFGNAGSIILMAWGLIAMHRAPHRSEWMAFAASLAGAGILLGRSLDIDPKTALGDLLCLLAGLLYAFYILLLQRGRAALGSWSLLTWSSVAGLPVLLGIAVLRGEPVWPQVWWPLLVLAFTSQVVGQGLLVYALRHFPPLVVGLALMTQPALAVTVGWLVFGETLSWLDAVGMVLVGMGLVLARGAPPPVPAETPPEDAEQARG